MTTTVLRDESNVGRQVRRCCRRSAIAVTVWKKFSLQKSHQHARRCDTCSETSLCGNACHYGHSSHKVHFSFSPHASRTTVHTEDLTQKQRVCTVMLVINPFFILPHRNAHTSQLLHTQKTSHRPAARLCLPAAEKSSRHWTAARSSRRPRAAKIPTCIGQVRRWVDPARRDIPAPTRIPEANAQRLHVSPVKLYTWGQCKTITRFTSKVVYLRPTYNDYTFHQRTRKTFNSCFMHSNDFFYILGKEISIFIHDITFRYNYRYAIMAKCHTTENVCMVKQPSVSIELLNCHPQ